MNVDDKPEKVLLQKNMNRYVGISSVYDYIYRPLIYNDITLYEWIQMAQRVKIPAKKKNKKKTAMSDSEDELDIIKTSTHICKSKENFASGQHF
jgi:hypothetical protein